LFEHVQRFNRRRLKKMDEQKIRKKNTNWCSFLVVLFFFLFSSSQTARGFLSNQVFYLELILALGGASPIDTDTTKEQNISFK
jgi:hypothetical protein